MFPYDRRAIRIWLCAVVLGACSADPMTSGVVPVSVTLNVPETASVTGHAVLGVVVQNRSRRSIPLTISQDPRYSFLPVVTDQDGELVWRPYLWVAGFPMDISVRPSGRFTTEWTWDMTDMDGVAVSPGTYQVTGYLMAVHTKSPHWHIPDPEPVWITVLPE